jgi:hypothetical protein
MNFRQFQLTTWHTLDCLLHKYGGWWTWNTNIQNYIWLLCCLMVFPHKCTSLVIFGQVVCPNILKCQVSKLQISHVMNHSWYIFESSWNFHAFWSCGFTAGSMGLSLFSIIHYFWLVYGKATNKNGLQRYVLKWDRTKYYTQQLHQYMQWDASC